MKIVFAILLMSCGAYAAPLVVEGGLAPDHRLAVAVLFDRPVDLLNDDKKESVAYLMDVGTQEIISPLEEISTDGGGWGNTKDNVQACWSPDSRFVAVTQRVGRMMHDFTLYRIQKNRAIPQNLPDATTHPKGAIFKLLTTTNNPGSSIHNWLSPTSVVIYMYGLKPKDLESGQDYSKWGLENFDGQLEVVYSYDDGKWRVKDIRVPKETKS